MITLTHEATTLALSERLVWSDEHAWQPPQMATDYGTRGDLMVHVRKRQAGRPITLEGVQSQAWTSRADVLALQAWAALPGAQFILHLRGQDRTVMFDHSRGESAFDAQPIWRELLDSEFTAELWHLPMFRFIEV